MKNALIWIMCMIVVAGAAVVIADKVLDLVERRNANPAPPQPASRPAHATAPADGDLLARLDRVERTLDAIRASLEIPPPDPEDAIGTGGETDSAPSGPGIGERMQWLESEMGELKRRTNRDLMQIYSRLRRRLDEMEAKLDPRPGPDAAARAADLKKHGVVVDDEKGLITLEAAFAQPTRVLEFIAVGVGGNAHESLLVVNALPSALKRALESWGLVEAHDPPYDPKDLPKDSCVYVYVTWPDRKAPIRVEKLIKNIATGKPLAPTPFLFTASRPFIDSRTWDEHLAADLHKHTIVLTWNYAGEGVLACPDPEALSEYVWMPDVTLMPEPPSPATIFISKAPRPEWE